MIIMKYNRMKPITFKELNEIYQSNQLNKKVFRTKRVKCPKCGILNGELAITSKGVIFTNQSTKIDSDIDIEKGLAIDCKFCGSEIKILIKKLKN